MGEISNSQNLIYHLDRIMGKCEIVEENADPFRYRLDLEIPICYDLLRIAGFGGSAELLLLKASYLRESYGQLVDDRSLDAKEVAERDARNLRFEVKKIIEAVRPDTPNQRTAVDGEIDASEVHPECYVLLSQMAAIVNREKRTLERLVEDSTIPPPGIKGGGGKPNEWLWSVVRPILEKEYERSLPEVFPADRFVQ